MYKTSASKGTPFISSKSVEIYPDVTSAVGPDDVIHMTLPSYLGFIDPRSTTLAFDLQMTGRGRHVPDASLGAHALFRDITIRDGPSTCTLEQLDEYNATTASTRPFTRQTGVDSKRELFEGVQPTEHPTGQTLYYGANPVPAAGTPRTTPHTRKTPAVELQLQTGLFGSETIIPVAALQGLRLTLHTEDVQRACQLLTTAGTAAAVGAAIVRPQANIANNAYAGAPGTVDQTLETDIAVADAASNPFDIGDLIYCKDGTGAEQILGVITSFEIVNTRVQITFTWQGAAAGVVGAKTAATTAIYFKVADRGRDVQYTSGANTLTLPAVSYSISNLRMKCLSVAPPTGYSDGMMKQAASEKGFVMDIATYSILRHNVDNVGAGLTHAQIPSLHTRARAVIVQPLATLRYRSLGAASFAGVLDEAQQYQFHFGSDVMPSRMVELGRYSQNPVKTEPIHLFELEKAVSAAGQPVRSLHGAASNFIIGRGFARYGQTSDLSAETLSVKVRYGVAALQQKIFNCCIYHLNRITISRSGVTATI